MPRGLCPGCQEVHRVSLVWAGQGWCSPECITEAEPDSQEPDEH